MNALDANELKTLAYEKVREMILSQELEPGQKIVQDKLAKKLGISRTPLRGALQMLEAEHLIESIPRRGVVVKQFSDEKIVEIYDCRIALETMAAKGFIETSSVQKMQKLGRFFNKYKKGQKKIDIMKYQEEDTKFHDYIIENCGNDFLIDLFKRGNLLHCIRQIGLIRAPEETLEEHKMIIAAMMERDAEATEKLFLDHLLNSKKLVMDKIQNGTPEAS